MDEKTRMALAEALLPVVRAAGAAILRIRAEGFETRFKDDASPVTGADLASEAIICAGLSRLGIPIPVVGEEHAGISGLSEVAAEDCFLVDALDGTREFVAGRSEFTVNIALVEKNFPTMGIILAPETGKLFLSIGMGLAFEQLRDGSRRNLGSAHRIADEQIVVLASRSHLDAKTRALINRLEPCTLRQCGSSLKFALLASGEADLYPRLAPTMAWDTAAGQALVEATGGVVVRPDGSRLTCSRAQGLRNEGFVAARTEEMALRAIGLIGTSERSEPGHDRSICP